MKKKLYFSALAFASVLSIVSLPFGILSFYLIGIFYIADSPVSHSGTSLGYPFIRARKNNDTKFVSYNYDDYQIINFLANRRENKVAQIENTGLTEEEENSFSNIVETLDISPDSRR